MGIANSIYLFPVYVTAGGGHSALKAATLDNIPPGMPALLAATCATYVLFGSAMFLLYKEFEWFTEYRHKFLARPRPDNYTVFVKNIPTELQTNDALLDYFRQIFSHDAVIEAHIAMDIPNLQKNVFERRSVIAKLEHAINVFQASGERPRHKEIDMSRTCSTRPEGVTVDSIDEWMAELEGLNDNIKKNIKQIEEKVSPQKECFRRDLELALEHSVPGQTHQGSQISLETESHLSIDMQYETPAMKVEEGKMAGSDVVSNQVIVNEDDVLSSIPPKHGNNKNLLDKAKPANLIGSVKTLKGSANIAAGAALSAANAAAHLLVGSKDGTTRDAGFVTFSSLKAKASAIQMIHHPTPFTMKVLEAPLPKDVFWGNVGLAHKSEQIGVVIGNTLTVLLCLFWTVVVSFLTALGEVERIKTWFPFLEDWIAVMPWIEMVLLQLKPLLLVLIVGLLPSILAAFSKREGHISESTLSVSVFSKLSVFLLVQIFFVQMLSGAIISQMQAMIENPLSIITLLAESLPMQAQSFMQYVIVQTSLNLGKEMVRFGPIAKAWIRKKFGPNLTKKERKKTWMGLSPLCDPPELDFADVQAKIILYYMITFVYGILAPVTGIIMFFTFLLFSLCYRNQLMYVYPTTNDTGGQLFTRFANLVMVCMLISEVTMFGVLSLKKGAIAASLIIPLIVITVMFKLYLRQEHYNVTKHLPSIRCVEEDWRNMGRLDFDFLKGEYVQPALKSETSEPDNLVLIDQERFESQVYLTPENSQIEGEESDISIDTKAEF